MVVFRRWLERGAKDQIEPSKPGYYHCLIRKVACTSVHDKQWLPLGLERDVDIESAPKKRKGARSVESNEVGMDGRPLWLAAVIRLPTKEMGYIMNTHAEELCIGSMQFTLR
ncbi:hypothetical protein PIIN_07214 [Serendipita indica DSM 11827]|uniref:Uncharacterized protein n=1 Tax=Serendipita indica (strain DSM 11827) TaxID=1109443 RepID=G4TPL6_SERID|nr:hypothetical protein PIIN_07214 [Serendipita indica DSM 11827]